LKIIKLNAIDSTNSFLKELALSTPLENCTVVVAKEQKKGRGQQKRNWISEPLKNLTISVYFSNIDLEISNQKYLNFAISLAIFDVLSNKKTKDLSIKWPNDILSANKKICGILIENTVKGRKINNSIIGIGLNVNQEEFPDSLKNVTSLKKITNKEFDLELLLVEIILKIEERIKMLSLKKYTNLETDYLNVLYKKNIPTMFKDSNDALFMGKIIGVSSLGYLQIELEDETVKEFGIKEVSLA
jgi:BirA family biotin operon repressor/biotin-[acetyl-CoA-carboxylase] ligase